MSIEFVQFRSLSEFVQFRSLREFVTHSIHTDNRLLDAPGEIGHMRRLSICDLSRQNSGGGGLLKELPVSMRRLDLLKVCV